MKKLLKWVFDWMLAACVVVGGVFLCFAVFAVYLMVAV